MDKSPGTVLFQCDDAPVHKAGSRKKWFPQFVVEELEWPAQSPELKPIQHLWGELERRLEARPSLQTSLSDLTNVLLCEWAKIPTSILHHLVESLHRRVEAVIAAKGGPGPYECLWI